MGDFHGLHPLTLVRCTNVCIYMRPVDWSPHFAPTNGKRSDAGDFEGHHWTKYTMRLSRLELDLNKIFIWQEPSRIPQRFTWTWILQYVSAIIHHFGNPWASCITCLFWGWFFFSLCLKWSWYVPVSHDNLVDTIHPFGYLYWDDLPWT